MNLEKFKFNGKSKRRDRCDQMKNPIRYLHRKRGSLCYTHQTDSRKKLRECDEVCFLAAYSLNFGQIQLICTVVAMWDHVHNEEM